jgi:glucose-6-phosphate isomerase
VNAPEWLVAWAGDEQSAVLEVTASGPAADAVSVHVPSLVVDEVASRIARKDPTLWGPDAEAESSIRLGWVEAQTRSRDLVDGIVRLREELAAEGVDRVVLCGMGGSSLAPEVITRTAGVPLVVLDSTDPQQVRSALVDLPRAVVVVSSKSGSTVETDSQRRAFEAAFAAAGIDAASRIVVVTDPGSPLEQASLAAGYRAVFRADPHVGGRFSALTAFGMVPSGLAGVDVAALLEDAEAVADLLGEDAEGNPGLALGAAIAGTRPLRDKLVFVDEGSGIVGFADWAEQLIAESTGKNGTGLLPVVAEPQAPEVTGDAPDVLVIRLVGPEGVEEIAVEADGEGCGTVAPTPSAETGVRVAGVTVAGPLGAQFLLWEYATAVAGRLLDINPFDQPDVESAKKAARGLLEAQPVPSSPDLVDTGVEIRGTDGLLDGATDLDSAVTALLDRLEPDGYLAVMAYLDRAADAALAEVRTPLAARTGRPVTFGWGPRFLHSTGQYHKGGPARGVYLQITAASEKDLPVPGRPFGFGELISAQAAGDAAVLAEHGRPVLRLHLTDRSTGVDRIITALGRTDVGQAGT